MPANATVWIVLIVVAGLIVGLALWFGRRLRFTYSREKGEASFETDAGDTQQTDEVKLNVAEGIEIEHATVGDISGIKTEDATSAIETKQNIDVAKNAKIKKGSRTGDISGIKQEPKSPQNKP